MLIRVIIRRGCERALWGSGPLLSMPPSVRDWLLEDHLVFFVIDVVAELDLAPFFRAHRLDGRGGAVYDPAMMLSVLLYAYCTGERSSRRIERRLIEDVAYRVLAVNQRPDHATLARFRRRHQDAIAGLFGQVLALCVQAGLVDAGVVAIDGTKLAANASFFANRNREDLEKIAAEILDEAEQTDAAEDELLGDRRGEEMPAEWAGGRGRRERIRAALGELDRQDQPRLCDADERAGRERSSTGPHADRTETKRGCRAACCTAAGEHHRPALAGHPAGIERGSAGL